MPLTLLHKFTIYFLSTHTRLSDTTSLVTHHLPSRLSSPRGKSALNLKTKLKTFIGVLRVADLGAEKFLIAKLFPQILPRCMQCRRGLAMRKLSVCLSVKRVHCDKTKKDLSKFLYHTKDHLA